MTPSRPLSERLASRVCIGCFGKKVSVANFFCAGAELASPLWKKGFFHSNWFLLLGMGLGSSQLLFLWV